MSPDAIIFAATSAVAAGVVLYIVWSNRHYREESERKRDQQNMLFEIQRDLNQQQTVLLNRCRDLQRKLDDHRRILQYLRHRLS
jgi:uncharacterized protein YlxW (UPF0749 family)